MLNPPHLKTLLLGTLLLLASLGCTLSKAFQVATPTPDETQMSVFAQATLQSLQLTDQAAFTQTALVAPTDTPSPTFTPTQPPTATSTPTPSGPVVTSLVFATEVRDDNTAIDPGYTFKKGVTKIFGVFEYSGFKVGSQIRYVWQVDGEDFASYDQTWEDVTRGVWWANAYYTEGEDLDVGDWTLSIYVDDQLAVTGNFTISP
jgi:hypothetical protein